MNIQQAYNAWSESYDAVVNKTRDLEARAIRALVPAGPYAEVIELGCGTGKNTVWLAAQAGHLTAVDFSADMMAQARQKLPLPHITFQQADVTQPWAFADPGAVDLVTCSLILEHIPDLDVVFAQASRALRPGGLFYIGELHPFKQYQGSKARFDTAAGHTFELQCYVHHLSDYTESARQHGFGVARLQEWFDEDDRTGPPRIVALLLEKQTA
ncbi:class I SAM-dependent methyltransferase [Hymenobacter busanensis]|uniref:Class I SAM-dependent methyltransferase n=1 Tax=Hymenobacter busanensis TaxID=2607656 RepID=A0A7L4ZWV2_9BACT|nr:class I SAM-dependent methyltransferase [Hymenobacter busanensis]KAA9332327.1 class I SAM-dependent methyltransferase [Hymenobacter busanensis]QHJ07336.1 methyltransferase domain-containing protein [Hymenobacter busanensis]